MHSLIVQLLFFTKTVFATHGEQDGSTIPKSRNSYSAVSNISRFFAFNGQNLDTTGACSPVLMQWSTPIALPVRNSKACRYSSNTANNLSRKSIGHADDAIFSLHYALLFKVPVITVTVSKGTSTPGSLTEVHTPLLTSGTISAPRMKSLPKVTGWLIFGITTNLWRLYPPTHLTLR